MRRLRTTLGLYFLIMTLVIAACGGDKKSSNDNKDDNQSNTSVTTGDSDQSDQGGDENLFSEFDEADVPFTEDIIIKNGLTLLTSNYFVQDDYIYVMYVVRNDSGETIRNIHFSIVVIDKDRLPLDNYNFSSSYNNIPPGQVIPARSVFRMDERWAEYYDGVAAAITVEADPEEAYTAYFETDGEAELDVGQSKVQGNATNVGSDPLTLVTATFALYDENNEVIAVVPALPVSGVDDQGYWQPGVTVNFQAEVIAIADGDLAAVKDIQLVVAGYVFDL